MRVTVESHEKNGTAVSVHSKMESGYDNRLVICDREGEGSGGGPTSHDISFSIHTPYKHMQI